MYELEAGRFLTDAAPSILIIVVFLAVLVYGICSDIRQKRKLQERFRMIAQVEDDDLAYRRLLQLEQDHEVFYRNLARIAESLRKERGMVVWKKEGF